MKLNKGKGKNGKKITRAILRNELCSLFADTMLRYEGLGNINGAYAEAKVYDNDDKFAYIEGKTGVQDMGDGCSNEYKSQYKIRLETLYDKTMPAKEKIKFITDTDVDDEE